MISVVIVDDHQVVRTGLKALLENAPGIDVTAEFGDGSDFLTALPGLGKVSVVLLDISMPRMGGLEVLHELVTMPNAPGVIFLTVYSEESYALQAIRAGAKGYLTKECSREMLVEAVTAVAYGGTFLSEKVRKLMFSDNFAGTEAEAEAIWRDQLSSRELSVFIHICRGLTIKEISFKMALSPKTVSTYKTRLMEKLQVSTLSELIKIGLAWGLTK